MLFKYDESGRSGRVKKFPWSERQTVDLLSQINKITSIIILRALHLAFLSNYSLRKIKLFKATTEIYSCPAPAVAQWQSARL